MDPSRYRVNSAPVYPSKAALQSSGRLLVNGVFINRQKLQPGDLVVGDKFGSSVAVDMQTSTIAASSKWRNQRGAVYIFYSPDLFFSLQQVVQGSDTQQDDGFGQSVAIVKNVLVVGANEHFNSNRPLTIRKAIQTITTSGSSPLGKTFRVGFRKVSDGYEEDFVYGIAPLWNSSVVTCDGV
ncbi:hypothetical protein DYB32_002105 [Aphanomyces invadans]|uniref:Uncharacterized protein n=1 Tax=Aphanomyces invadans TaxID=157072 RepID=A0A418B469_9STRA|nr:hypothetical protein DYB32_002105 [Aphanomyces invadans]